MFFLLCKSTEIILRKQEGIRQIWGSRTCWGIAALQMKANLESQNHRIVEFGRDLCGSSSPNPLPKQGHLQQAAQDLFQAGLECSTMLGSRAVGFGPVCKALNRDYKESGQKAAWRSFCPWDTCLLPPGTAWLWPSLLLWPMVKP